MSMMGDIMALLESSPGAAEVMDDIRTGRLGPQDAILRLASVMAEAGHGEALVKASSRLTDMYGIRTEVAEDGTPVVMKHDNTMMVMNPIMEAALKERASIDGDVPEGRTGPMLADATPAVPVLTDSLDPVVVGYQLEQASKQVQREITKAIEDHDDLCTRLLTKVESETPADQRVTALEAAKKHLPPVPTGVAGYEAGQRAVARPAVDVPMVVIAEMNPVERRQYVYRGFATTQGRVSTTPVIERGVIEYLQQHGIEARAGDPDPKTAVMSKWVMVVWGADDLSDGFNPIVTAIHSMASEVMDFTSHPSLVVRVTPYHGIADRRFGWTLVAAPKERTT
jgi:hypothetical protein